MTPTEEAQELGTACVLAIQAKWGILPGVSTIALREIIIETLHLPALLAVVEAARALGKHGPDNCLDCDSGEPCEMWVSLLGDLWASEAALDAAKKERG